MAFKFPNPEEVRAERARRDALGPEGRDAEDRAERFRTDAHVIAKDEAGRDAASKELRVITLAADPYARYEDGAIAATFHYKDDGSPYRDDDDHASLKRAIYVPSEAERLEDRSTRGDAVGRKILDFEVGMVVSVLGEEKPRRWKDSNDRWRTVREFHAQRFGEGVMTREQLMAREPGGLAERAEAFVAKEGRGVAAQAKDLVGGKGGEIKGGPVHAIASARGQDFGI